MSTPGLAPAMQGKVANTIVSNPMEAALNALKSGKDVEKEVYGTDSTITTNPEVETDNSGKAFSESFMEDENAGEIPDNTGSESSSNDSSEEPSTLDEVTDSAEQSAAKPDVEEIIISDESGRKKVTVDWNDKEKLRKYVQMAAGMRKFQAERDTSAAKLKALEPQHKELKESWDALENAYSQDGVKGLVNLLIGKPDAYDKFLETEVGKRRQREEATPTELARIELQETLDREKRERQKLEKRMEEYTKANEQTREEASQKALESQIHPAFEKYRFKGKLGNEQAETKLDKAIWRDAMETLQGLPEDAVLTSDVVNNAFKEVSLAYKSVISKQAEEKTKQIVTQKKQAAQQNAAVLAKSGMKINDAREEFKKDIKSGDLTSALRSVLTGKFKF